MKKFKERIYSISEFYDKEYAEYIKKKTEGELATHKSLYSLVIVLYIITIAFLVIPIFVNLPDLASGVIGFITPITYIVSFALQIVAAYRIMGLIMAAAFSAGLDMDKQPLDFIVGALYTVLTIIIFVICPPASVKKQINKDNKLIKMAENVISSEN